MTSKQRELAASAQRAEGRTGDFDAVVIGAGFAGIYMLYKLRDLGLSAIVLESAADVGGTWYWNRYPGARCDVESLSYQYSFSDEIQREWNWSERYATQPEILRYAQFVAEKFDLRRDMQFETKVTAARWDEAGERWTVETDRGDLYSGQFLISGVGCLSMPRLPEVEGIDDFQGNWYHTGRWPHEGVDLEGLRVGVIGTGSSGIQSIPAIAGQAKEVTVFQRTPNFSVPAVNHPLSPEQVAEHKDRFQELRREAEGVSGAADRGAQLKRALEVTDDERTRTYEEIWEQGGPLFVAAFRDLLADKEANDTAADFVRRKIRETVSDPAVANLLSPTNHPIGTKRICVDIDYFETYNRENVSLVDIRRFPIERITPAGLRMADGRDYEFDAIVFATGFDAMTGALMAMDIRGRDGRRLRDEWRDGPVSYLGLMVAGFPNLFTITGPGSPSVLSNMLISIEQHVDWIGGCLEHIRTQDAQCIEAEPEAQLRWVEHVAEVGERTLYPLANSWYMGANVPGKPRVFMPYVGGVGPYREKCDEIAANDYEGFAFMP